GFPTSPSACRLASGAHSGQPKSFCHAECLNEEPDVGKPLVRFCEGLRHNRCRAEILWHRRETRRQTENTNVMPIALEGLILLDKNSCGFTLVVFEEAPKPFATPNRAFMCRVLAGRRKEQHVALALMIPLVMIMRHVLIEGATQGRFAKQNQPRQTLLFDRSHPALRVRVQIWRPRRQGHPCD